MKRIYQTTVVSIALLFCAQTAHAALMPVSGDQNFFTIAAPGPSSEVVIEDHDSYYVSWFQFTLALPTDITLDTLGSIDDYEPFFGTPGVLDTVLALYDYSLDTAGAAIGNNGKLLAQNDNCSAGVDTSCLTFSALAAGSYLAGITTKENSPFADDWVTPSDTSGAIDFLFGTTQLNLNVNPVPVPAAFWLFGTALLGFVGMSRRRSVKS